VAGFLKDQKNELLYGPLIEAIEKNDRKIVV
jgi:hypothetical protein